MDLDAAFLGEPLMALPIDFDSISPAEQYSQRTEYLLVPDPFRLVSSSAYLFDKESRNTDIIRS